MNTEMNGRQYSRPINVIQRIERLVGHMSFRFSTCHLTAKLSNSQKCRLVLSGRAHEFERMNKR